LEEFIGSGEYAATVKRFHAAVAEEDRGHTRSVPVASGGVNSAVHHQNSQHLAKLMSGHR